MHNIVDIRPRSIFELIEEAFPNERNSFTVNIPPSKIGGLLLLESAILVSLARLLNAKEIFEFGTYMGATSVLLAENSSADTVVTTLDLDPGNFESAVAENPDLKDADENDEFLRDRFINEGPIYINQADTAIKGKITQIYKNSLNLDIDEYGLRDRFDLIFVDGGHDIETITIDTQNSLKMAKRNSVIAWHDFRSGIHTEVTDFINEFCSKYQIVHVQNTMLALLFLGDAAELIRPKLEEYF